MLLIGEDKTVDRVVKGVGVGNDMQETGHRLDSNPTHLLKGKPHRARPKQLGYLHLSGELVLPALTHAEKRIGLESDLAEYVSPHFNGQCCVFFQQAKLKLCAYGDASITLSVPYISCVRNQ